MTLLIDNYDSFTYILNDYLLQAGLDCIVVRNDEVTLQAVIAMAPQRIIISPGPETPVQAGVTLQVIAHFYNKVPILGVCLGHQALGMFFGGHLYRLSYPMHGKVSQVAHYGHPLFEGIPPQFPVMRYHSLAINNIAGSGLTAIAHTADGTIMALVHERYACTGLQFHPESVGTPNGLQILKNWLSITNK